MLSLNELLAQLGDLPLRLPESETVALGALAGRVLALDIQAPLNQPQDAISAMDGYALRCADLTGPDGELKGQGLPVSQRVPAGSNPAALQAGTAARIFTGAVLPQGADTIVMQEHVSLTGDGSVLVASPPRPGQWVRQPGDDLQAGQCVLHAGEVLTPGRMGLLASLGLSSADVRQRVRVGVLFTGDELRQAGEPLARGQIYNSNRWMWRALLDLPFVELHDIGQVQDDLQATRAALRSLSFCDLILSSGGVSVGEEDHIKAAVEAEGSLQSWKVAMKPGKPIAVGKVQREDGSAACFVGLPGNPVSSFASFVLLVRPLLLRLAGVCAADIPDWRTQFQFRAAAFQWTEPDARRVEFLRARINGDGQIELFPNQNSSALASVAWAEGFVKIEAGMSVQPGSLVPYLPISALLTP